MEAPRNCVRWTTLRLLRQSREVAWGFRLGGGLQEHCKLYVTRVTPGSPAALASLQRGDTIELIDGIRGADLTYSDAMQILQRNSLTMMLEIMPGSYSRDPSSTDLNSMLSASHSRNTSFGAADGGAAMSDCLSPSSSVVNLLQTHNPAPMTAWSMAQPAFRRVNSQEARSPLVHSATGSGGGHFEYPPPQQQQQQLHHPDASSAGGGQMQQLQHNLGQAVRRRNASSLARSPGYHNYVRQLQQYGGGGGGGGSGNAWDPPDPLSGLRRSNSAATLPHSFRTGGGGGGGGQSLSQAYQPPYQSSYQSPHQPLNQTLYQPQSQMVPDKLLSLYQSGTSERRPFSYTPDNQQLERELQDAFMRRRRSRPRHRSTSTELGQQSTNAAQYERSASLVADRTGSSHYEAARRCANDITRYFGGDGTPGAADPLQSPTSAFDDAGPPVNVSGYHRDTMSMGRSGSHRSPAVQAAQPPQYQSAPPLKFPAKQERKVSTSSVTLSCQPSSGQHNRWQPQQQQQQQLQHPAAPSTGNQSFRVLQWLSNSSEMQDSSVRDEVKQKLSSAGRMPNHVGQSSPTAISMTHQMQSQQQQQQQYPSLRPVNHVTRPQQSPARLSSSVSDLRGGAVGVGVGGGGGVSGGGPAFQRLNSAVNSPVTNRAARSRQQQHQLQLQQRRQQRQAEPDAFDVIRATIRANQQARGQQQGTAVAASTERRAAREEPDELSHNAKFQRIREKLLQQQLMQQHPENDDRNPPGNQLLNNAAEVLREDFVDSAARIHELKQIQHQQATGQIISNGQASAVEAANHYQADAITSQAVAAVGGLTEF